MPSSPTSCWTSRASRSALCSISSTPRRRSSCDSDSHDWRRLLAALDQATELARQHGLRLAVHPHLATVIERPEDVQRVLDGSTAVLCLDTGHYTVGGGDGCRCTST